MAIDTRQKRESAFGISLPFTRALPLADGADADSEDERAHLVMNYNGIATAVVAANPKGPLGMPLHGPFGGPIGA